MKTQKAKIISVGKPGQSFRKFKVFIKKDDLRSAIGPKKGFDTFDLAINKAQKKERELLRGDWSLMDEVEIREIGRGVDRVVYVDGARVQKVQRFVD